MPGADRLWYRQPAGEWNEALPVGNGRLGAMVFGYPDHEKLQLNEETLWAGSPIDNNNPAALEALPLIRKALFEGDYAQAGGPGRKVPARHPAADPVLPAARRSLDRPRGRAGRSEV